MSSQLVGGVSWKSMCVGRWYWHIHSHRHMLQLLHFSGSVLQSAEVCVSPQIALAARVLT